MITSRHHALTIAATAMLRDTDAMMLMLQAREAWQR